MAAALSACGTVDISNGTASVTRDPAGVYRVEAVVTPSRPSVAVRNVLADVTGVPAPITMERLGRDRFVASVPLNPCEGILNVRYTAVFERDGLLGRDLHRKTAPTPGEFRIPVTGGTAPAACGPFQQLFSQQHNVDDPRDIVDAQPGDGVCSTGAATPGGPRCTLRAAIMESNATVGHDVISIPPGTYALSLRGGAVREDSEARDDFGDLDITDDVTLRGGGSVPLGMATLPVTIDGAGIDRVFEVHHHPSGRVPYVEMHQLRITNGSALDAPGAGILNHADLRLDLVKVDGNRLRVTSSMGVLALNRGGGIANLGRLFASRSVIEDNETDLPGGSPGASSGFGGGLWNADGAFAELTQSLVASNRARFGGGVANEPDAYLRIVNSTIGGNRATARGGGAFSSGRLSLWNSTVARNSAPVGAGLNLAGESNLINTAVLDHLGQDCAGVIASSGGGNAFGSACAVRFAVLPDSDLVLPIEAFGALGANGGHAPSYERARALTDRGIGGFLCPPVDQRGLPRPADGDGDGTPRCDIGAVESQP
jgi:hypothetical protein